MIAGVCTGVYWLIMVIRQVGETVLLKELDSTNRVREWIAITIQSASTFWLGKDEAVEWKK